MLERFAHSRLCLADWEVAYDVHMDTIRPLLVKAVGEISGTHPAGYPPVRYTICDHGNNRYLGFVPDEYEVPDFEDRWFNVDELQIWVLDPEKVAAFLGPMNAPHVADKPVVKVHGDFDTIILPDGRSVVFGRKYKRRGFLKASVQYCRENMTDVVHAQTAMANYNATLPGGENSPRALRTTDVVYDLFRDQVDIFKELFEIRNQSTGIFRLKVTFESL